MQSSGVEIKYHFLFTIYQFMVYPIMWQVRFTGKATKQLYEKYHCHLKAGRPTYVACWELIDKKIRILEVYYVGTREKAPY
jgi:hypothetical protein